MRIHEIITKQDVIAQEIIIDYWILEYPEGGMSKNVGQLSFFKVKEYKSERPLLAVKHYT